MDGARTRARLAVVAAIIGTVIVALAGVPRTAGARPAAASGAAGGTLIGRALAPRSAGAATGVAVADVAVTATAANGTRYSTATAANGWYDLERLPAGTYSVTATGAATTSASVTARHTSTATLRMTDPAATITGIVRANGAPAPGTPVSLSAAAGCATAPACATQTAARPDGRFTLHVPAGSYRVRAPDAGRSTVARTVTPTSGAVARIRIALAPAPVPAGTRPHRAGRDLRWLNAERVADGLPGGLVLSSRWSQECAAHDRYERDNHVLAATENPESDGASIGGAWAGLHSDLGNARWMQAQSPWEDAPIHLLALLAPSLKVVGIDDSGGYQCVTTYPGLTRAPTRTDRIFTYPAAGASGVPTSERASESPFTPGQFVGLPGARATGRELFVYLNLAHQFGQAPVDVLSARLQTRGHQVALRWVDSQTPTVGRYLTGAILIPVKPLRAHERYIATVRVRDRSATITRRWQFRTR